MAHTLPARPSFLPAPPEPSLPPSIASLAEASTSQPASVDTASGSCAICSSPPKYTCPGCTRRTCSLNCSKVHKDRYGCSGQRSQSAYIPLKGVTEGVWSDDYKYLEEGRRRVSEWGGQLPKSILNDLLAEEKEKERKGKFGGRGMKRKRGGQTNPMLRALEGELERRGVGVEFMAEGMERRRKNQSSWNAKNQTLYMSAQFLISPKAQRSASTSISTSTNTEPISQPKNVFHNRLAFSTTSNLHTCLSLLPKDLSREDLVFVLSYHIIEKDDSPQQPHQQLSAQFPQFPHMAPQTAIPGGQYRGQKFFPPLQSDISLMDALKGTSFIEYPSIRVYERAEWQEMLGKGDVMVMPLSNVTTPSGAASQSAHTKQQHQTTQKAAVASSSTANVATVPVAPLAPAAEKPTGLGLGDYGSDDDEEDEDA